MGKDRVRIDGGKPSRGDRKWPEKSKITPPKVRLAIRALLPLSSTFDQVAEDVAVARACGTGEQPAFHPLPRLCYWRVKAPDIAPDDGKEFTGSQPVPNTRFWVFQDAP
jgi:hypothetical protein